MLFCHLTSEVRSHLFGLFIKVRPTLRKAGRTDLHFSLKWASVQDPPQSPGLAGFIFAGICDLRCANQVELGDIHANEKLGPALRVQQ